MNTSFVQLLQISIGNKNSIDLQTKNWPHLFEISNKQSILGITYVGLEKTKKIGIFVNPILFTKWYGLYESLKKRNEIVDEDCCWVTQYFDEKGFNSCILKGQGLNLLYKNADEELVRTAGDVDIWLMPKAI